MIGIRKPTRQAQDDPLARAVAEWKRGAAGRADQLSDAARARIHDAVLASRPIPAPRPLFGLFPRRLAATILPIAAAVALVAFFPERSGDASRAHVKVRVGKSGDEVVFTIANGTSGHTVYKSNDSSDFGRAERIAVQGGTFRDRVADDAGLVFYRID